MLVEQALQLAVPEEEMEEVHQPLATQQLAVAVLVVKVVLALAMLEEAAAAAFEVIQEGQEHQVKVFLVVLT